MRNGSPCYVLSIALVALLAFGQPLMTAVIVVDGACTLVDAINAANSDSATGGCKAGLGADEIQLTVDVTLTEVDNITAGANGLPSITSDVKIEGVGGSQPRSITRDDAAHDFRIFDIAQGGTLRLESISVRNGSAAGYFPEGAGGAIRNLGDLILTDSIMSANSANFHGGAIFSVLSTSTVSLMNSRLSDNSTPRSGGAIFNNGSVTLTNSTVSGNTSGPTPYGRTTGGGIKNNGRLTNLTLTNSTVSGNTTGNYGGGIYNGYGIATLTNSTVSGNSAEFNGGGIMNYDGTVTLTNSTVSGNSARSGGGIYNYYYYGPSNVILTGSLVANSLLGGNCSGHSVTDDGNNLADDDTCGTIPDNLTGLDPLLAANGGPTKTHALLAGSEAIDLAGNCGLAIDQRLAPRDDGDCDAGSFEFGAVPPDQIFTDGFEAGDTSAWSSTQ